MGVTQVGCVLARTNPLPAYLPEGAGHGINLLTYWVCSIRPGNILGSIQEEPE